MATLSIKNLSQAERVAATESELRKHVAELFPPVMEEWKSHRRGNLDSVLEAPSRECARRMIEYMGEEPFREGAAEIYFKHGPWYGHDWDGSLGRVVMLYSRPAPELVARIDERLEHLCRTAYEDIHLPKYSASFHEDSGNFSANEMGQGEPSRATCTALLLAAAGSEDAISVLQKIADGSFNYGPFQVVLPIYRQGKKVEERAVPLRSYQRFQQDMFPMQMTQILWVLAEAGQLTKDLVAAAARNLPETLRWIGPGDLAHRILVSERSKAIAGELANEFAKDVSAKFDADWALLPLMTSYRKGCWLRGSWALLEAARHHERLKLGKLEISGWSYYYDFLDGKKRKPALGVVHLANGQETEPDDPAERKELIGQLRKFPQKTLEALLPVAMRSTRLLCEALGWEAALPLMDSVYARANLPAHRAYVKQGHTEQDATRNSPDPTNGVIDLAAAKNLIDAAGQDVAGKILTGLAECNGAVANTATLFGAAGGFNATSLKKGLAKRNQTAIKAFGLLPLTRGAKEALERYKEIKQFEEESEEFGPERKANERAAAQAALTNLAQVAGYPNALRLEWAMEAQQGAQEDPFGRSWKEGEHRGELVLDGGEPRLRFYSKQKPLKTAPAALKESDSYQEMKELLASTKQQYKRMRSTFENMMIREERLSGADFEMLSRLPIGNQLLTRLVFAAGKDSDAFFGTWAKSTLTGLASKKMKVGAAEQVRIAHPYDLLERGQLAAWQAEFVRREWAQPFRQIFREVYLPMASERDREECDRFKDQLIKTSVASRLLASRGWEFRNVGHAQVSYFDREKQLLAEWAFPEASHYLAEQPQTPAGVIRFAKGVAQGDGTRIEKKLKMCEIPPVFLSEVLRDADLVSSVAAVQAKARVSQEVQERRADAVRAVLAPLGVEGVSFEGEFVRVKGKLAEYKVSCQNASIVREPGTQTFVFPAGTRLNDEKLFLPFTDEDDEFLSAVCTAVLLLAHDDKIRDKSLLKALQVSKE